MWTSVHEPGGEDVVTLSGEGRAALCLSIPLPGLSGHGEAEVIDRIRRGKRKQFHQMNSTGKAGAEEPGGLLPPLQADG